MKKVYLVHCWDGTISDGWYQWLKGILKENNIEVVMENMPNTETPAIDEWVSKLDGLVEVLNENVYFIGHSIGCQTIMRYLETKETTKVGGILFIAPWLDLLPKALGGGADAIAKPWLETPIDFNKVKQFTNNITCIFSDDDYFVSIEQEKEFKSKLDARTAIVTGKGHISGDDGVTELPIILNEFGKISGIEFLDIVDEQGNLTGKILDKNLAHDRNLLHNEIGIFILNSKDELLIQKRAATKRYHPNIWGLCAGHVDAHEDLTDACVREAKEELGIDIDPKDIKIFDTVIKNRDSNSHVTYGYYIFLDYDLSDFTIQEEELSELKWIPFKEYKQMVLNNDPTITFTNNSDNIRMLDKIENIITERK